jgi:hypothetical protein
MWMPPLPGGVLDQPAEPGLRVTYADDGFLLATKLIAQRAKDADDVGPWPTAPGSRPPHPAIEGRRSIWQRWHVRAEALHFH